MEKAIAGLMGLAKPGQVPFRPFNLVRWFLVLGFTSIAITSVVSAFALSNFLKSNMLERDATVTMEFVNSIVHAAHADRHLIAGDPDDGNEVLEKLFEQIASVPEVIRANLYGKNRTILWSSDPAFIGAVFRTNRELDRAFNGEVEIEEGTVGENKKAEHAFLKGTGSRFVENYLPIRSRDGRVVIGVAEVYKTPDALYSAIDHGTRLIWLNAISGGIILYIALIWIIHRANLVIGEQQRQLIDAQALAAIGEMASAVAHGLRNPLASIRTSAEVSLGDAPPPPVEEALKDIVAQSDRLERWVRELLTASRPEAFEFEEVQINDLLSRSVEVYASQMKRQTVALELRLDSKAGLIEANTVALGQVVNSLIANALEAMPGGGDLTITSSCADAGKIVSITVADTGQGIPESQIGQVFEPFVTTKGAGLGVGLPLAKRIVERHRGRLDLSAAPGGGTLASIELPAVS